MARTKFDAIVIGSGFGGSVMTYNLILAGMTVCLLERGKEYKPGEFPRTPDQLKKAFWDPSEKLFGLFNIWSFKDLDCVVSSGLGGGSLIYANVLREKNENWFEMMNEQTSKFENWPITFHDLKDHYNAVKAILNPVPYPDDRAPYNQTPKNAALRQATRKAGLEYIPLNLAITFGRDPNDPVFGEELDEEYNLHNSKRFACRLCGECFMGCNYGSKNTLDLNYLSMANKFSLENPRNGFEPLTIKTLSEVTAFKKIGDFWEIQHRKHIPHEDRSEEQEALFCRYLILCAGSLGTTFLMLKNKENLHDVSTKLGKNFSGNGDLLNVADGCSTTSGGRRVPTNIMPYFGPVITGAAMSDPRPGTNDDRFYIEDWSYTKTMIWLFQAMNLKGLISRWVNIGLSYLSNLFNLRGNHNIGKDLSRFFGTSDESVSSFTMVGMGMDRSNGVIGMSHDGRFLELKSPRHSSKTYYSRVTGKMELMAEALGASMSWSWIDKKFTRLRKFPTWDLGKTVTVHPLGGCPIGTTPSTGVVNQNGEVFNNENLYIADGSVLPAAVGPNPSLTIAALSNKFAVELVKKWKASGKPRID